MVCIREWSKRAYTVLESTRAPTRCATPTRRRVASVAVRVGLADTYRVRVLPFQLLDVQVAEAPFELRHAYPS